MGHPRARLVGRVKPGPPAQLRDFMHFIGQMFTRSVWYRIGKSNQLDRGGELEAESAPFLLRVPCHGSP